MGVNNLGPDGFGHLTEHLLRATHPDHEVQATVSQAAAKVGDGLKEEGGPVGASLIEARRALAVVAGVKAVDVEDKYGLVVGDIEALIVMDVEVTTERDDGGVAEAGSTGWVKGAMGAEVRGLWRGLAEMVDLKEILGEETMEAEREEARVGTMALVG